MAARAGHDTSSATAEAQMTEELTAGDLGTGLPDALSGLAQLSSQFWDAVLQKSGLQLAALALLLMLMRWGGS